MQTRVPATVLSGFLGSGKTTLLNRLLADPKGLRIAVVVNEFGEVGIDGRRVAGAEQFVELDNGCLCCTINEDLKRTLFDLAARGGFDHLVVETTGLADPLGVAWTFSRPGLEEIYRLDAIVTLVDAANLAQTLEAAAEASLQIERGDLIVLNKLDLVSDRGAAAETAIRRLNARAPILHCVRGEVPIDVVLSIESPWPSPETPSAPPAHRPSFATYTFRTEAVLSDEALEDFFYRLPSQVYRLKGLVRTDATWRWTLVNAVAGRFEMEPFSPDPEPTESVLVFIGPDLDREGLARACSSLVAPS